MRFRVVTAAVGVVVLLAGAPVRAHFDGSATYTHGRCPASPGNAVDPINVVFFEWGTWGRVVDQVEAHAGWTATSGSGQTFVDHGECHSLHAQRASGDGSRFHVRVRGQHPDAELGWTATGDAHHEDVVVFPVPCGHAVDSKGAGGSGFDQGREELRGRFAAASHDSFDVWWGNTRNFKQCDDDYAGSDGWTLFVRLHQVSH